MEIRIIKHGTDEYNQMVELRTEILRKPLGLSYTAEQLAKENEDTLVAAFENDILCGCCMLSHNTDEVIQLRQMAVGNNFQGKGVGRKIIGFAENWAKQKGYKVLMMHARDAARGFYNSCGYRVVGDEFTEVGIPHHLMEKTL